MTRWIGQFRTLLGPGYYSGLGNSCISEALSLSPVDATLARRCPICGQNIETNEARDYGRRGGHERALQQHMNRAHPADYARSRRVGIALLLLSFSGLFHNF